METVLFAAGALAVVAAAVAPFLIGPPLKTQPRGTASHAERVRALAAERAAAAVTPLPVDPTAETQPYFSPGAGDEDTGPSFAGVPPGAVVRCVSPTRPRFAHLPVPMILVCPECGRYHVDAEDSPPHATHLCQDTERGPGTGCGKIWKPGGWRGAADLSRGVLPSWLRGRH